MAPKGKKAPSRSAPRRSRLHPSRHTKTKEKVRFLFHYDELAQVERQAKGWDAVRGLLGGKGANLAEMTRLGLPVPPGFCITTQTCKAFGEAGERFPSGLWDAVSSAVKRLEQKTGKGLGNPQSPLLLSCRSGAKFSMPGMMDTVLNIGLTDEVAKGLCALTQDRRFVYDAYRRLVQMYGTVVLDVPDEPFEERLAHRRRLRQVDNDADLPAEDLEALTAEFQDIVRRHTGRPFPTDPSEQLRLAIEAVFRSWNGKRAHDYRVAAGIPHDLGTAVNVMAMVFGNLGEGSGTGVATTRNVTTGENTLEGDFLLNAQGEDVVAGTRTTLPIEALQAKLPAVYDEFVKVARLLERHYKDVQDVEFTIERGKLWMLQTRDAKRTAQAAIRIAVDLAHEKHISRKDAVRRVKPEHVDYFLHPQFDAAERRAAKNAGALVATGLNVSPGAAIGQLAFDADTAERWAKVDKRRVIMLRPETKPDDVHGMLAAQGVITSRGGRTSHAALVARQFGKPAVVGVLSLEVDTARREARTATGKVLKEGDWVSIDGTTGEIFSGQVKTLVPDLKDPFLLELLGWADGFRRLGVWTNADYPHDAALARSFGAEGIGLCRTEHMFFETNRLPLVQQMILSSTPAERAEPLGKLLPIQRDDFRGLFKAMDGLPVTIRLIDPPLHEFLPSHDELLRDVTETETRLSLVPDGVEEQQRLQEQKKLLLKVEELREQNPMLGLRGVRLGIHMPELVRMQVRAIFEAACDCRAEGVTVKPKVMIPLAALSSELRVEREMLEDEAKKVMKEKGVEVPYQFGTMIEVPRAALVAERIAQYAEFFSFGTNDLTQTTFGISRDDAETGFLMEYLEKGILNENPFATLDQGGVGQLMRLGVRLGRSHRKDLEVGICGEHGGDPRTIGFCHAVGLNYVSCSPYRVPIARLAAAQAALGKAKELR